MQTPSLQYLCQLSSHKISSMNITSLSYKQSNAQQLALRNHLGILGKLEASRLPHYEYFA